MAAKLGAVRQLVAIDLPGGPGFVRALLDAWEDGDAVAPLDQRLGREARQAVMAALAPGALVGPDGRRPLPGGRPVAEGDALVVSTSGSTGRPKGVVLTHDAVRASALATSERLGVRPSAHRWLACLPLNHVGGLSVVTRALLTGTPLEVHPGFEAGRVLASSGPDVLVSLVPTALARVGAQAFRTVVLGGSAPPTGLAPNVVTTYGLTETGSGVVYDGVPLDGVEVSFGRRGEIMLRGPMLLRCYRDGSSPLLPGGWLATGDSGHLGPDGRLEVDGRLSELMVTGGENVWPGPVEGVLCRHPGVAEAGLTAVADPEWGDRLVAVVVPSRPATPPSLDELRHLVRDELAPYAAPRALVLVDELPKTSIGKLRRDELARLAALSLRAAPRQA